MDHMVTGVRWFGALIFSTGLVFSFFFLGLLLSHKEVPRLGIKMELQLPAYTIATATPDP